MNQWRNGILENQKPQLPAVHSFHDIHTMYSVPSCILLLSWDRVSLCNPGCPGTHSVNWAVLEFRDLPASASQVLGLKVCTTTAQLHITILKQTHLFRGLQGILPEANRSHYQMTLLWLNCTPYFHTYIFLTCLSACIEKRGFKLQWLTSHWGGGWEIYWICTKENS